tara:strand:- start:226 stop:594 length:369 start_codon:yes stop_codon:yes gene_type:complete
MKKWYLIIDDIRELDHGYFQSDWYKGKNWSLAKNVKEAMLLIEKHDCLPINISFDHDLGVDSYNKELPSGYDFAQKIVDLDMNNQLSIPEYFDFRVHSDNPVGKINIESYINNYLAFKKKNK